MLAHDPAIARIEHQFPAGPNFGDAMWNPGNGKTRARCPATDVFVRDTLTGTNLFLMSMAATGSGTGNAASFDPVLSADGRWIAFVSSEKIFVTNDANLYHDIFVRDLQTGVAGNLASKPIASATIGKNHSRSQFRLR